MVSFMEYFCTKRLNFDFCLFNVTHFNVIWFLSHFSPSEQNEGLNINPNILPSGKNKSIVGPFVAVLATIVFLVSYLPFILIEGFSVDFGSLWDIISFLLPTIIPTFLIPIMFYFTTPKSFAMIKDIISDMF